MKVAYLLDSLLIKNLFQLALTTFLNLLSLNENFTDWRISVGQKLY